MKKKLILVAVLVVTLVIYMAVTSLDYSPLALIAGLVIMPIDVFAAISLFSN